MENICISEWKKLKSHLPQLTVHVVIINTILITIEKVKKIIKAEPRSRSKLSDNSKTTNKVSR
jgi:hypothetical protein